MKYCPQCGVPLGRRIVDGVERVACTARGCAFVHWDNPTPVVAAIVRWRDHYVLARNVKWPAGMFSMITGFLERNEAPEAAIRREAKEELGLDVAEVAFIGHWALTPMNQLILAYLIDAVGTLVPGSDVVETRVLTGAELGDYDFGPLQLTAEIVTAGLQLAERQI